MSNKNETTKKPQPKSKPKVDYKSQVQKLKEEIELLKKQNINLEAENQKNLYDFQNKAKTFQDKANEQIKKIKEELANKLETEKKHITKFGSQKLIESIIEPILNIDVAVASGKNQDAVKAYVMGFEMLMNQLYSEMESFGIQIINPNVGDTFDPNIHYAMKLEESGKSGKILDVKKKGIKYHERVIKPATVVVGK